jgi:serine/threonine-protein kinase
MGAVLRGRDVRLGRDLAVKVLLEKHAHKPEVVQRFIEEAEICGQLEHPGVVPVYDSGSFGGRPFIAMKLVKGQTLAAILSERPDPTANQPRLLGVALKIAHAMAYAHAKGVIHRDLKPANIMVGKFGEVQVMDWGLAKVLVEGGLADEEKASRLHQERDEETVIRTARSGGSSTGTDTEAGSLLGTPAYMPPEQANGDVALLDRRADVFGLGAILCEVLTGKPPYVGRSGEEVRRKAANGDLADAHARLAACGADEELIALTKACLSPEPIDRPKDAQAVADALSAYIDGVQDRLRRAEVAEAEAKAKTVEEAKRGRLRLVLAATVLLAVGLGAAGWLWTRADREARMAVVAHEVNDALNRATALREQAKAANGGGAALFAQAREQSQRALALAEGGPVGPSLLARVQQLQEELDQEEKDRQLVFAIDEALLAQADASPESAQPDGGPAVPLFREALRAYGLTPGEGVPAEVAEWVRGRPQAVREAIIAALDEWDELANAPGAEEEGPHREWLRAVLDEAERQDDWGRKVRAARREPNANKRRAKLEKLAASADVREVPAQALARLARLLRPKKAAALLRRAQQRYPTDFWVNHGLGMVLQKVKPPEWGDAVRFLTAAAALRQDSPRANLNLGKALGREGQAAEALSFLRRAARLGPNCADAQLNLGIAIHRQVLADDSPGAAQKSEADVTRQKQVEVAIQVPAKSLEGVFVMPGVRVNVISTTKGAEAASKLVMQSALVVAVGAPSAGKKPAARMVTLAVAPEEASRLKLAQKTGELGLALSAAGYGAGPYYTPAMGGYSIEPEPPAGIRPVAMPPGRDPELPILDLTPEEKARLVKAKRNPYSLRMWFGPDGNALVLGRTSNDQPDGDAQQRQAKWNEAIACYKKAVKLGPKNAVANYNLGLALYSQGRYADALTPLKRAHELGKKQLNWRYPAAQWAVNAERMATLEAKQWRYTRGEYLPTTPAEALELAVFCRASKSHLAAARLYASALADPKLPDEKKAVHRTDAASSAALAVAEIKGTAKADARERQAMRRRALTWLRLELARLINLKDGKRVLAGWQEAPDLAGLRDKKALAKLPAEERAACEKLWADVASLARPALPELPAPRKVEE